MNVRRLLAALCCAGASPLAAAADWRMDAAASKLEFVASFERAPAPGVFREFQAQVRLDPADLAASRIEVDIAVTSADMGHADVNRAIRGPEWFDFARFPQAAFRSAELRPVPMTAADGGASRYLARGTLDLKGVQQAVEVPFTWRETADAATMEGELTLQRGSFGIGLGEWAATRVIGPEVRVKFKLRLNKAS